MSHDLIRFYSDAAEDTRLTRSAHGRLEFLRTQELVRRHLTAPADIVDVGGGTGVHARWLAADGHTVHLIDPVPAHVSTAAAISAVTAEIGDARALPVAGRGADVVLLLGPLYHLTESADRATALAEAHRVLRPGGLLVAAAISRYLSVLEAGSNGALDTTSTAAVEEVIGTGAYDGHAGFVPTHWHTADELRDEVTGAGFTDVAVYGVEGPVWPALDRAPERDIAGLLPAAAHCARIVERDPLMINSSAHLLAFARRR